MKTPLILIMILMLIGCQNNKPEPIKKQTKIKEVIIEREYQSDSLYMKLVININKWRYVIFKQELYGDSNRYYYEANGTPPINWYKMRWDTAIYNVYIRKDGIMTHRVDTIIHPYFLNNK